MNVINRLEIEDLKEEFKKNGKLSKNTLNSLLNEINDLRDIQDILEKILNTPFSVTLPSTAKGHVFQYLRLGKIAIQKYWTNIRNVDSK